MINRFYVVESYLSFYYYKAVLAATEINAQPSHKCILRQGFFVKRSWVTLYVL